MFEGIDTITKAMLGGVSNHPKALKICFRGNIRMGYLRSFAARGRRLTNPILHDHLTEGNRSGVNPRSEHVQVSFFQLICLCTFRLSTFLIFKYSCHTILLAYI
ncbi:unnamed protein product [Vicia faba]|uniref:Uncharacterized protein n=1 Tax=Vicia faba TaxID=3906 RepID=A0AAV1AY18_VICFA|nr:unnamed protein product [Vicia faba]